MHKPRQTQQRRQTTPLAAAVAALLTSTAVHAAPGIRTAPGNSVPQCVSPERLMAFVAERNPKLDPRYREIARWYQYWGDAWHVRWDYAFYQMVLETNYLMYRRGNGERGDVHEKQNNFAGIGATGGGVAGEKFPDIKTGVLAQIEHLVAYSGEKLAKPVAKRTQENQDDIISKSRRLGRAVTFGDLARRWATDRQYAKSIDTVSELFRKSQCNGTAVAAQPANFVVPAPQPARRPASRPFPPPSLLGGPKPHKLAGPDMPAAEKPIMTARVTPKRKPSSPSPRPVVAPAEKAAPEKPHPPVRTIWSRDSGGAQNTEPQAAPPAGVAPQAQVHKPSELAPAAAPQIMETAPAAEAEEPPSLPQFKIKPLDAPPLRLGGPVAPVAPPPGTQLSVVAAAPRPRQPDLPRQPAPARQADLAPGQRMSLAGPVPPPAAVAPATASPAASSACRVLSASYGGNKTLLVKSSVDGVMQLTALTVIEGFEKTLFETYAKASAPNAEIVGEYASRDEALSEAHTNCEGG